MPKSFVDRYYDSWASSPGNKKKIKEENDREEMETKSASPSLNFLQKHFGPSFMAKKRKGDIELPNSGQKDKRLRTKLDDVKEGYGLFKKIGKK